jgi:hypothetical protein
MIFVLGTTVKNYASHSCVAAFLPVFAEFKTKAARRSQASPLFFSSGRVECVYLLLFSAYFSALVLHTVLEDIAVLRS